MRWCREMLRMSPLVASVAEGGVQRRHRRARGRPAAGRRRDAPVLHDGGGAGGARRVRREARPGLLEVPEAAVSRARRLGERGAPRTLGASVTPVVVGTAAAGHARPLAVRRGAARRARAAGGREPRERLPRRCPRRGHGRARWARRAHLVGTGLAARGAGRRPRMRLRRGRRRARARRGHDVVARADRRGRDARPLALQRRPEAVRGARPRRGDGVPVLRRDGHGGERVRAGRDRVDRRPGGRRVPMGLLAVAILVANNLRDIPTDAARRQADARGPAGRTADAGAVPRAASSRRSPSVAVGVAVGALANGGRAVAVGAARPRRGPARDPAVRAGRGAPRAAS